MTALRYHQGNVLHDQVVRSATEHMHTVRRPQIGYVQIGASCCKGFDIDGSYRVEEPTNAAVASQLSGNSVHCPRSAPATKHSINSPSESPENHGSGGVSPHGVIPGRSHTEAFRISSPGIDEARLLSLATTGELQWSIMSD